LVYIRCQRCNDVLGFHAEDEKPPTTAKWCKNGCEPSRRRPYPGLVTRKAKGLRGHKSQQHGLDDEAYLAFMARGKCDACGTTEPGHKNGFMVDHDHLCCPDKFGCPKCVRGLLCHGCNVALGAIRDDANRLLDLYAYLYRDQGMPVPQPQEALT
jgi:hypothetical protein